MKKALITDATGQDGSYLAEFLLAKGYEAYEIIRRFSSFNTGRIDQIYEDLHVPHARLRLIHGDLNDASSLNNVLHKVHPDEIYNLGAQSHVRVSFDPRSRLEGLCQDRPSLLSASEVDTLIGDASKAEKALGWRPTVW